MKRTIALLTSVVTAASCAFAFTSCGDDRLYMPCLLYTSDAADDLLCVDIGGRRLL